MTTFYISIEYENFANPNKQALEEVCVCISDFAANSEPLPRSDLI